LPFPSEHPKTAPSVPAHLFTKPATARGLSEPSADSEIPPDAAAAAAQTATAEFEAVTELPRIFTAFRYRDFCQVWAGNFLSNIGTWMQNVAQGWLVLQLTNSAFWVGMVSFAAAAPLLVFTILGGVIADHVDRRKMLMASQFVMMFSALALATLTYTHRAQVHHVLWLAFLTGLAASLAAPAQQAIVPMLVPREHLTNAIGLNSAQFNMSRVLGPTIGGFFMAWFGPAGNFALNGLSFLALIFALVALRLKQEEVPDDGTGLARKLAAGFRYVWERSAMKLLVVLICITAFLGIPYFSFIPVFARDICSVGERGLGLLMASQGLGSFFAALTIAYLGNPKRRGALMAISGIVFFCAVIAFSFSHTFGLSAVMLFIAGYSMIIMVALINTRLQHSAEEEMRGRTMSIYATAYLGLPPVGSFVAGVLTKWISAPHAIAAMAAAGLGVFLLIFGTHQELRDLD
jgi:MFS family permease